MNSIISRTHTYTLTYTHKHTHTHNTHTHTRRGNGEKHTITNSALNPKLPPITDYLKEAAKKQSGL